MNQLNRTTLFLIVCSVLLYVIWTQHKAAEIAELKLGFATEAKNVAEKDAKEQAALRRKLMIEVSELKLQAVQAAVAR